nr:hypothetical protein [uncultured bacterium]
MKVAILRSEKNASPKVLATGLAEMLEQLGIESDTFDVSILHRKLPIARRSRHYRSVVHHALAKTAYMVPDAHTLKQLSRYDVIVVSECCPEAFYTNSLGIEYLRRALRKPIALYEVFFLDNSPYQVGLLEAGGHFLASRYDWHFAAADITEFRATQSAQSRWSRIGLNIAKSNLRHGSKSGFLALVDFPQRGNERFREEQIRALKELRIDFLELRGAGRYSVREIREIYNQTSVFFIQHMESFGVSIAEALAAGNQIFSPSAAWPMAWKIGEKNELPGVFTIYEGFQQLKEKLNSFRLNWERQKTPARIFAEFVRIYPHYYFGEPENLLSSLHRIIDRHGDRERHSRADTSVQ